MSEQNKYQNALSTLAYAFDEPDLRGRIKVSPEHFSVTERMEVVPSGEGEHVWLDISKTQLSSERVAKGLARYAGVAYRDVGYSGMKDVQAVTRQWFSVWLPKNQQLDWSGFDMQGVFVHTISKHHRKLKRGTHKANSFDILVTDIQGDLSLLEARFNQVKRCGVPNYFGEQRFGRDANNLVKAEGLFSRTIKIKDRNLKSIVLSSARSFLFNLVLSERIKSDSWCELLEGEPAALDGSNSVFPSSGEPANAQRLLELDIHPTAPMWGRGAQRESELFAELADFEQNIISPFNDVAVGLEAAGLEYQRRAIRSVPKSLEYEISDEGLRVKFELQTGQFATSILRELVGMI